MNHSTRQLCVGFLFSLFVTGCNNNNSESETVVIELSPEAEIRLADSNRLIEILVGNGCLPSAIASPLRDLLNEQDFPEFEALAVEADSLAESDLCSAGSEAIQSVAGGSGVILFEPGRVFFDASGNGSADSLLMTESSELVDVDADDNGLIDYLWQFEQLPGFSGLPTDLSTELASRIGQILDLMFLPFAVNPVEDFEGWQETRSEAITSFDQLLEFFTANQSMIDAESYPIMLDFLLNTRPVVENYTGCLDSGSSSSIAETPEECSEEQGCAPPNPRFYVYTDFAHGWKGLSGDDTDIQRGLYPTPGNSPVVPHTGTMVDDSERPFAYRLCWDITAKEWQTIFDSMEADRQSPPTYSGLDVFGSNCMSWAAQNAAKIGRKLPDYTYWGAADPLELAKSIEALLIAGSTGPADRIETPGDVDSDD